MLDLMSRPWPWYVAGPLIGLVVPFVWWYGGRKWGISSTFRHVCAAVLPTRVEYFRYDWRRQGGWQLAMAAGVVVGGFVAGRFLGGADGVVAIAGATRAELAVLGVTDFTGLAPADLFSWSAMATPAGVAVVVGGGFLVGLGTRWAGGCTSGHAISGLADFQWASLFAVVGFFVGGLIATHLLLPVLL